jgi:hypothetical protein
MVLTDDDYKKHQDRLDKIAQKGEHMAGMTKFAIRNLNKIILTAISLIVGGAVCFLWGYFNRLNTKEKNP